MDLSAEVEGLWAALGDGSGRGARVIQLVAARAGEGTSTVARSLAAHAAVKLGLRVWMVDLDLAAAAQSRFFAGQTLKELQLGSAQAGSPDKSAFFAVRPTIRMRQGGVRPDCDYLESRRIGNYRWWVTRFRSELLRGPQKVHVLGTADYWAALKPLCDVVIIDCQPSEKSQAAVTLSPFADQTVLIVSGDQADVRPPAVLRNAILSAGGNCAGLFFNRAPIPAAHRSRRGTYG
jgi:cellulose biosynthesis protein BcsQ